jgi:hypothetical protein
MVVTVIQVIIIFFVYQIINIWLNSTFGPLYLFSDLLFLYILKVLI